MGRTSVPDMSEYGPVNNMHAVQTLAALPVTAQHSEVCRRVPVMIIIETDNMETVRSLKSCLPTGARMQVVSRGSVDRSAPDQPGDQSHPFEMTARQQQILELLLRNLSNKQIGRALNLSHFTVRNHISQILRLLGVSSRKAAMAKADLFLSDRN